MSPSARGALLACLAVALGCIALAGRIQSRHPTLGHPNRIDTVFGAVLPAARDPVALRERLGLEPACDELVHTNWYLRRGRDALAECPSIAAVGPGRSDMAKLSKRVQALRAKVDRSKSYPLPDALSLIKGCATAKFDESIDVAVNLGVDAKKSDQVVRGSVVLPAGTGKNVRVAVFAQGEKAEAAKAAGADVVGFDDLAAKV